MTSEIDNKNKIPVEIDLVSKVKACKECQWFWGAIPPYGPFPAFDWDEKYPQAIKDGPPISDDDPVYWTQVKQVKGPRVEPAVLRGCRKAPIMTVGINPNMTAFFAGSKATTWAYPYFQHQETYAYYYRHATIYQESFDLDDLKQQLIEGSEVIAEHDGTVTIGRSDTHRWLSIEFKYNIESGQKIVKQEYAWQPDERLVIFARDAARSEQVIFPEDKYTTDIITTDAQNSISSNSQSTDNAVVLQLTGIRKGDLIAAKIQTKQMNDIRLFANKTEYYDRATPILNALNTYLNEQGFENCHLTIGEDISMHDMVGCASPGWSAGYKIPMDSIREKCVDKNQYMFDQLVQSKPRLLFIVSTSSLNMFAPSFINMGGKMELDYKNKDTFQLLKETTSTRSMIYWENGDDSFSSRVIVTPHFSYKDNFYQQSRFEQELWHYFIKTYPDAYQLLSDNGRVKENTYVIYVDDEDDPLQKEISPEAWALLMIVHINPYKLIEMALQEEHIHQPLITDKNAKHLDRAQGSCTFCVNKHWEFPEGCDYGLAEPI